MKRVLQPYYKQRVKNKINEIAIAIVYGNLLIYLLTEIIFKKSNILGGFCPGYFLLLWSSFEWQFINTKTTRSLRYKCKDVVVVPGYICGRTLSVNNADLLPATFLGRSPIMNIFLRISDYFFQTSIFSKHLLVTSSGEVILDITCSYWKNSTFWLLTAEILADSHWANLNIVVSTSLEKKIVSSYL